MASERITCISESGIRTATVPTDSSAVGIPVKDRADHGVLILKISSDHGRVDTNLENEIPEGMYPEVS